MTTKQPDRDPFQPLSAKVGRDRTTRTGGKLNHRYGDAAAHRRLLKAINSKKAQTDDK